MGQRVKFRYNGKIKEANFIWLTTGGFVQLSENRTPETMGFAQNWVVPECDVIDWDVKEK